MIRRVTSAMAALCRLVPAGGAVVATLGLTLVGAVPAAAEALDAALVRSVMPDAVGTSGLAGTPPVAAVEGAAGPIGYAFWTDEVSGSVGYSGRPLRILVGLGLDGVVTGAKLVAHAEPILVIGVSDERLAAFVASLAGIDVRTGVRFDDGDGEPVLDAVSGATYSSVLIAQAVLDSARVVARAKGLLDSGAVPDRRLDRDTFAPLDWNRLMADGSLATLRLTNGDVSAALGLPDAPGVDPSGTFVELHAALATPASIGRNLLGEAAFRELGSGLGAEDQMVFLGASGLWSFKGTEHVRTGVFERFQIVQGVRTFRFDRDLHRRIDTVAAPGAPALRETGVFVLPAGSGFDPLAPWRLDLVVERDRRVATFSLDYLLPARLVLGGAGAPPPPEPPLWRTIWAAHPVKIAILAAALVGLTVLLVLQDGLARRRRLHRVVRLGFLAFTLVWIGWYAGAQLSVVNVLSFVQALMTGFRWEVFLVDPLMFVLWSYVAVAMLFWGRGVFCGWLCPFGALQELLNQAARALRVRQVAVPFGLHERLWPIKYIAFLGLFALSLGSLDLALRGAEIEPFKTAITLRFLRAWPFVAFVVALLVAGLFVERFYCRYLCPLGAALAIPARLRMFDWLKRRHQCGTQCQICASRCTVQAIHPDGRINPNECIHCLQCQVNYYDDRLCPPLIERRKRKEARAALRAARAPAESRA
jgi:transcriptional regulator of nitric oxide reductase